MEASGISYKFGGVWGEERRAHARMSATDDIYPRAEARCSGFPSLTKRGEGRFAPVRLVSRPRPCGTRPRFKSPIAPLF